VCVLSVQPAEIKRKGLGYRVSSTSDAVPSVSPAEIVQADFVDRGRVATVNPCCNQRRLKRGLCPMEIRRGGHDVIANRATARTQCVFALAVSL